MNEGNKFFLKVMLTIILIFGIIFSLHLVSSFIEESTLSDELTTCERMCYPSSVEEEVPNRKCVCLPLVSDH